MERKLLKRTALLAIVWLAGSGSAWCQDSEGALGSPLPPPTDDPPHVPSHYFPPAQITAGIADTGPALSSVKLKKSSRNAACGASNPCARPTPARDRAALD